MAQKKFMWNVHEKLSEILSLTCTFRCMFCTFRSSEASTTSAEGAGGGAAAGTTEFEPEAPVGLGCKNPGLTADPTAGAGAAAGAAAAAGGPTCS